MSEQTTIIERHRDLVVIHIQPETINEQNLESIRSGIVAAALESPQSPVALDMGRVAFLPSLSMAGLIQLSQSFRSRKQRLVLFGLRPAVREALVLTRLDRLFEIQHDLSAVVAGPG